MALGRRLPAHRWTIGSICALSLQVAGSAPANTRQLTFEERVKAQEAIERVYYSHQIGATRPFEEVVTRRLLEQKVRLYLRQSAALEVYWKTPVTAVALRRERDRMAAGTRSPERLRQLQAALGDDPLLTAECLARPALVGRLTRNFFAFDETIHAEPRRNAEKLRQALVERKLDPLTEHPARTVVDIVRDDSPDVKGPDDGREGAPARAGDRPAILELRQREFDRYSAMHPGGVRQIGPIESERDAFVIRVVLERDEHRLRVASFRVPKIGWDEWWGSVARHLDGREVPTLARAEGTPLVADGEAAGAAASATCLPDDTWDNGSLDVFVDARYNHYSVSTGSHMIVWGGFPGLNTGGRYDPATDTWAPTSTLDAPAGRYNPLGAGAVWTGTEMIVWGGDTGGGGYLNSGGRYDPATDTWSPTNTAGAPSPRVNHTSVWTGDRMIVWGGYECCPAADLDTGGLYDPVTDTWTPTSLTDVPVKRELHTAVWTGSEMLVWGGSSLSGATRVNVNSGGRYDPRTDAWTPLSVMGAPSPRYDHTAVWTGSLMIVWGGFDGAGGEFDTGGRYDPSTDTWAPTATVGAPLPRYNHTAVWSGSRMIVWGGNGLGSSYLNNGGRYDPEADSWSATTQANAPSGRQQHSAVWTGQRMIVWGGLGGSNTGGRYDPVADSWTPTSAGDAPPGRGGHIAVWTGNHMIIWGGGEGDTFYGSGDRYDPVLDTWTPISTTGAPSPRSGPVGVWTGNQMIVWSGFNGFSQLNTGGRYDPVGDTWLPTTDTSAPTPRESARAVWTGSEMIVWGGYVYPIYLNDGGRYDPVLDRWLPTSTVDAPSPRRSHTAIWSGSQMIVWGGWVGAGGPGTFLNDGGRYDPSTDHWLPTNPDGAPSRRRAHTAVWTGSSMIVWGGLGPGSAIFGDGARYDPLSDSWLPTSLDDAPTPRAGPSAVWTGGFMILWGGLPFDDTGSRYDPSADTWEPTSTAGAPSPRAAHTAVWSGSLMIVWGGFPGLNSGGRYALGHALDDDGDGMTECEGDCDDANFAVHPRADEVCDGRDNDCDARVDNAPVPEGVPSLAVQYSGSETRLGWSPVDRASGYDVVQGDVSTLIGSGGDFTAATQICAADNLPAMSLAIPNTPVAGRAYWYLVRAENCGGSGTYDSGSPVQHHPRDAGINASALTCP